jgi:hypothetical protein
VIAGLRRFLEAREAAAPSERCELCAAPVGPGHGHLVAVETRAIACACRPCWLLFAPQGAAGARYRAVPERVLRLGRAVVSDAQWDGVQVPVGLAFFFRNSRLGRAVALYPSPAGATECALDPATWSELIDGTPELAALEPDVEALLVDRRAGGDAAFVVPIDTCYALVGLVRRHWKGFDGGEEARRAIDGFFDELGRRCAREVAPCPS